MRDNAIILTRFIPNLNMKTFSETHDEIYYKFEMIVKMSVKLTTDFIPDLKTS